MPFEAPVPEHKRHSISSSFTEAFLRKRKPTPLHSGHGSIKYSFILNKSLLPTNAIQKRGSVPQFESLCYYLSFVQG